MIRLYNIANAETLADNNTYLQELVDNPDGSYLVIFLQDLDQLFTAVKKKTAYRGRFAKGDKGQSLLDQIAITDDERTYFDSVIQSAGPEVANKLSAWAKNIDQAYRYNVSFNYSQEKYIVFMISMSDSWDPYNLDGVDKAIQEALVSYVVKHWYYDNRYSDDFAAEEVFYQSEINKIRRILFMSKVPIRRPVDMFTDSVTNQLIRVGSFTSSGTATTYQFVTGPLVADTLKTVVHDQNMNSYTIKARSADNSTDVIAQVLKPNDSNPTNAIDIKVTADIPEGLIIIIQGI